MTESVKKWFDWYDNERPHQALEYRTLKQVYREGFSTGWKYLRD